MLETILGNLSVDAVLFIVILFDFSVDIEFFRVIFHLGSEYTFNECLLNRHREILTDNKQHATTSAMGTIGSILN